jgi:hypothetical protein
MTGNPRRRKWRVFSVRTMLLVVLAFATLLGRWVNGSRQQREGVAAIRAFDPGANLLYDNELPETVDVMVGGGRLTRGSRPWWLPAALQRRLGRDDLDNVIAASFGAARPAPVGSRRSDLLREVARLRSLQQLVIDFPVSDADVLHLTRLGNLSRLEFVADCPELTDASLLTLAQISALASSTRP